MIVVTGASRGIGKVICDRLIANNVGVLGLARNVDALEFPSMVCDVSSAESIKSVVKILKEQKKSITGLINVAGIASMNLAVSMPSSAVEKIIQTNLLGTIFCCQQIAPLMIRNKAGVIINFSSIAVALGLQGEAVYAASKAGIETFSRAFARELAAFNINVHCIAPGPIQTDLLRGVSQKQIANIVEQQVFKKAFTPDAVADVVEILLDKRSASLSGQVFHVGGA